MSDFDRTKFNAVAVGFDKQGSISTRQFTKDQADAYDNIIKFIDEPFNKFDFKRAIVGAAGTGKTYSVKAIISNCKLNYSSIGLSAPTHKACRVLKESININSIKVNTLQSDLGLKLNFDIDNFDINKLQFDPRGKVKIKEYELYIIDEASMINKSLLTYLERMAIENNIKLLFIGDSKQLPPVGERFSSAFKNIKCYELNEIVRQGDDNPISSLLEILRDDITNKTYNFLKYITKNRSEFNSDYTKGYQVYDIVQFNDAVYREFTNEDYVNNVDLSKVVAYTNLCVNTWNNFIRSAIIKDAEKSIITKHDLIISYTTIVNEFNDAIIKNSEEYIIHDVVNYKHPKYEIEGFMVKFKAIHGGTITPPFFVVDHRHSFSINMYYKITQELISAAKSASHATRVSKWKEYYRFKEKCLLLINITDVSGKILVSRDIDYGFALTSHKSQGSTFGISLVDVNDIVYDKYGKPYTDCEEINRRLYVAVSRAKDKLYLKYGV